MASYRVVWKRSARKELRKLPRQAVSRVVSAVEQLTTEPRPSGTRKLAGSSDSYRIRVGDYRVIYSIFGEELVIEIVRVGHRKDVYR
jgi:mRNA interferase RelE/StbE